MIKSRTSVTVESLASELLNTWSPEDLAYVKSGQRYDLGIVTREIRNHFHLWDTDHPLTQHWHLNPECRNIVDDVDYSEDHPDAVSSAILEALRKML